MQVARYRWVPASFTLAMRSLTFPANIAVALATAFSLRVGLLDADVHGPSIGKMMNLRGKPEVSEAGKGPFACAQLFDIGNSKYMRLIFSPSRSK